MSAFIRALNRPVVAIVAVGLIAGILRFSHLGYPQRRIFDEYYYSKSACIFLGYSNEVCDINSADERFWREDKNDVGSWVHPPVGKWMIALGELAFGVDPFGWRAGAAVTGTLTVVLLALIVQLLFGSPIWTFAGGLLLAVESLHFVHSRIALLDGFVAFWIVLGFLLLLVDRRWIERRTPEPPPPDEEVEEPRRRPRPPAPLWRPWRFAAGAAFGAGFATKWSALPAIAGAVVLAVIWEVVRRKRFGLPRPIREAIPAEGFGIVLAFMLVPTLVYVVSYAGWFLHFGFDLVRWAREQGDIATFHAELETVNDAGEPIHPYLSEAWEWILLRRPIAYYTDFSVEGVRKVIYGHGNPAIFWGAVLAIPYTAVTWFRTRDWRAGFVVVSVVSLYLPWFFVPRPQFLFYATPISPFFVLACVYALRELSELRVEGARERPFVPLAAGLVLIAVGMFAFFWPMLTAGPLTDAAWKLRQWFPGWV
ncbi:MAG TPA: phospholipid carrier-dependent glycosyltransferase [Actinomycetota bacterium]